MKAYENPMLPWKDYRPQGSSRSSPKQAGLPNSPIKSATLGTNLRDLGDSGSVFTSLRRDYKGMFQDRPAIHFIQATHVLEISSLRSSAALAS